MLTRWLYPGAQHIAIFVCIYGLIFALIRVFGISVGASLSQAIMVPAGVLLTSMITGMLTNLVRVSQPSF